MGKKKPAPVSTPEFKVNPFAALNAAEIAIPADPPAPKPLPPPSPPNPGPGAKLSPEDRELLRVFNNASVSVGASASGASGAPPVPPSDPVRGRVRLQLQRKGKGGKVVTRVLGLDDLTIVDQMELARELRQALGTGAHFDEGTLELHGDQRNRAADWFRKNNYAVG